MKEGIYIKLFICTTCGEEFLSEGNHASYCPICRAERQNNRSKIYNHKVLNNEDTRTIGSIDICQKCKQEYIVRSGTQKVCDNCRKKYNNKMKSRPNLKYRAKNYDCITLFMKKGEKEILQELAKSQNMSLNAFINQSIQEFKNKLK